MNAESAELIGPDLHLVSSSQGKPAESSAAATPTDQPFSPYITGFVNEDDQARFGIQAPAKGFYDLAVAFRSSGKKGYVVGVNGLEIAGSIASTPGTGFVLQPVGRIELNKGKNAITIHKGWGYYDVAYIQLAAVKEILPVAKSAAIPVDPKIAPEAAGLLQRLDTAYGKSTFLGVYSDQDAAYVADHTNVLPSIMGGDLLSYSPQEVAHGSLRNKSDEVDRLIAESKAGYIITLSWHWCSPSDLIDSPEKPWWRGFYTDSTRFDVGKTLADPASTEYATMLSDIDAIAVQLRRLQDAHVPVLWRPLHEASGGWFWWGAKGPKPFVQLWQLLYDRLTNVDGIHNLIWVYTGDGDLAWYPGDKYVDVVGIDAYPKDLRDPQSQLWADLQRNYGDRKILAISEFGGVPDVPAMQKMGEFWSYAVSWSGKEGPKKNTTEELKRIYDSPGVNILSRPDSSSQTTAPSQSSLK